MTGSLLDRLKSLTARASPRQPLVIRVVRDEEEIRAIRNLALSNLTARSTPAQAAFSLIGVRDSLELIEESKKTARTLAMDQQAREIKAAMDDATKHVMEGIDPNTGFPFGMVPVFHRMDGLRSSPVSATDLEMQNEALAKAARAVPTPSPPPNPVVASRVALVADAPVSPVASLASCPVTSVTPKKTFFAGARAKIANFFGKVVHKKKEWS